MNALHGVGIPTEQASAALCGSRRIAWIPALFLAAVWMLAACSPKIVRVPVTQEDLARAEEALKQGDIAFARRDFYAALIKYLEAGRLNPNSEHYFNRIGITYSQLKFYQEAAEAFRRSIGLNPKYAYSVNNLGSVHFALKELKKAEKYFKKAIKMKSDEPSFYMNLGSLYFEKKKYEKAMAEWRKGLALDSDILSKRNNVSMIGATSPSKERSYFLARLHASAGNVPAAIRSLEQAYADGFTDIAAVENEPDFDPVRKDERFIEFLNNLKVLIRLRSAGGASADPLQQVPPR